MRVPRVASAVFALAFAFPVIAGEKPAKVARKPLPATGSAMKIHVDPVTGALVPEPDAAAKGTAVPALDPDLPPLAVQESPTPGGGEMVILDNRFMLEMTATVAPDGKVAHACTTEEAKGAGGAKGGKAAKAAKPQREVRRDR